MKLDLDLSYLTEISDGDQEFIADVLQTFLEEMPKDMNEMQQAVENKDVVVIGKMAHKTKSTLHTLGVFELKELALKIEQTSKTTPAHPELVTWAKKFIGYVQQLYPTVKGML